MTDDFMNTLDKQRKADRTHKLDNIKEYNPFYEPSLTLYIEDEVKKALNKITKFRYFINRNGMSGIGKTSSIYRQAQRHGWNIIEYNVLTIFDDDVKEDLKTHITSYNNPGLLILFDNIEEIDLPNWFMPTKEQLEDKNRKKNTFMDVAQKMYGRSNFTIMATATEYWKAPREMDEFFLKIEVPNPDIYALRRIAKKYGLGLPNGFPNDIRQLHYFIRNNGVFTPYKKRVKPFDKVRTYLTTYPKLADVEMRPSLEHWLLYNLFNNKYLLPKHKAEFYETMALICMADEYDCPKMLMALPKTITPYGTPIFYPK